MSLNRHVATVTALAALVFPALAAAQAPVWRQPSASERYHSVNDSQIAYYDVRRTAYDEGYGRGLREGQKDARNGDRFGFRDEREFQRADRGYHRSFGDRERYRQVFRDGYAAGYADGYNRNARYSRNDPYNRYPGGPNAQRGPYGAYPGPASGRYPGGGYYSPAFDNGVRDGYEKGREDAQKRRSFDAVRHGWYREGDRHYESRYGSRDEYKNLYRRGFQQGYEQGFRGGYYR